MEMTGVGIEGVVSAKGGVSQGAGKASVSQGGKGQTKMKIGRAHV